MTGASFSDAQRQSALIIEQEFSTAGLPDEFAAAAIVNAYHESRLKPDAVGDGGHSVGLFQLHDRGGGKGMSVAERTDPVLNTRRIIEEVQSKWGNAMREAYDNGIRSVSHFAALFSRDVERPADEAGNMSARGKTALEWFPKDAVWSFGINYWWVGLIAVGILSGALIYRRKFR
jgi:hypothetical protein